MVNALVLLGAALGPRLRAGCPNWKICKRWQSHGGGTINPEHRDECDQEHRDESKLKTWQSDDSKQGMQRFDAIEVEVFCKRKGSRVKSFAGGCILVVHWS